jgi:glycosyltransferase involved in cell wall biosynthesis
MLFRAADHVIVPSSALRPYVVEHGARAAGVRIMPNAANPESFDRRPGTTRRSDEFVIGFLGSLKPWHGVEFLVRAFRQLYRRDPTYRLLIVGEGPLRRPLERMVRQYRLQRAARFVGDVEHDAVPELLAQMDAAAAPYPRLRGFYFSPLKVFEYLAAGVPVVASDIGQVGEILVNGETALLHRPGAVTDMARQIEALRQHPELAARLAAAGQRLIRRRFTWRHNADRLVKLIAHGRARLGERRGSR